jgi:phosphoribosyl-ATP pyrophosphohydrolase/phosphoribosyl-AMP cyclohydrolase
MESDMNIDFDKMQGLVPAIVQDAANGDILMLGFMNREAWEKTQTIGYVTFYSRTRNELWTKGETSGNRLKVVSAVTDCDLDSLLIRVEVEGAGVVCHEGTRSCFTKTIEISGIPYPTNTALDGAPSKSRAGAPAPHVGQEISR